MDCSLFSRGKQLREFKNNIISGGPNGKGGLKLKIVLTVTL